MALKKSEVTKYKAKLEELREQIKKALDRCNAEVKQPDEATGYSQHQADQGTDDSDRRINLEITSEPIKESIAMFAERADSLGYLGRNGYDLDGIFFDVNLLETEI